MATPTYNIPQGSPTFGGVLVASGDAARRDQIISTLHTDRWPVVAADGGADALNKLENTECDLLLLDRALPDLDPDEFLQIVRKNFPGVEVVELGSPSLTASSVMSVGSVLHKVSDPREQALEISQKSKVQGTPLPGMVGSSEAMQRVYRMVRLVAPRNTTVLITGPTGSGKELVARALHELSPRAAKPFVPINCAAIPEALLESELFGYSRGAFTGAVQARIGRVQSAQSGTLFLDEIGDLPIGLQAKLLRFLERGELQRLGSSETLEVDVRVVAATNAELLEKVRRGEFRQDLYFRLSVFPVELPALADHKADIEGLAQFTLSELNPRGVVRFSEAAIEKLVAHCWPGNVRELRHVMERSLILADGSPVIEPEHIHFAALRMEERVA
jgi:DNA-binding NtrC family response regulator